MEFVQVDVFADGPYRGNQLAVFPDAAELDSDQMQAIAAEMNLSETTFVSESSKDSYSVRIFTPREELPFAGHPTLGTAWALRERGVLKDETITQTSPVGETAVSFRDDTVWFQRPAKGSTDLRLTDSGIDQKVGKALNLNPQDIGLEPRELGRSVNRLQVGTADAGTEYLVVPVANLDVLGRCRPVPELLRDLSVSRGAYCFTATRAGGLRARGFFPAWGIEEDPATGAAAACLGVYLASRIGDIDLEIEQGVEMGRPSRIHLRARADHVEVGGRCELIFEGKLATLP